MQINIDIQAAIAQRAGVGRYTKCLIENLLPLADEDRLKLFYFDFKRKGLPFAVPGATQKAVQWCPGRIVQKAWKTVGFPPYNWFSGPADVFHFPNFIRPPLTRGKSVVTIHDVSFLRHPETTERKNLAYMTGQIHQTAQRADAIITDSFFSGREIEELLNVPSERIFPIHLGLPEPRALPDREAAGTELQALGLERPFLLFVSTLEPRKNIPFLVELFEHMTGFDGDLVIAGMKGWKYEPILERIRTSRRAEHIRYLDYVTDLQLGALYRKASLFVFPSIYEGFGFPPLEAMQAGCPVLSSPAGSLAEVLGDAARLVEGYHAAEWAEQAQDLIEDHTQRDRLIKLGLKQVTRYDWAETARATWDVYRGL